MEKGLQPTLAPIRPTTIARHLPRTGLLDWLEQPTTDRGLHFASDDGSWSYWDYPRLARLVAEAAEKIEAERTRDSGPISIALPAGPQFVAAFLGALVAGHTPSPLALPVFLRDPEGYVRHVAKILEAADPALVISDADLDRAADACHRARGARRRADRVRHQGRPRGRAATAARPPSTRLLQFTSGSSGRPRGVQVTYDNLETNIAQMQRWLGMSPDSAWGSWLPLYHDMGLIGTLLGPMTLQSDVWVMRPDQFIRKPLRWLELFGRYGVEICMAPNFGYAYSNQRVTDAAARGHGLLELAGRDHRRRARRPAGDDDLREAARAVRVPPLHARCPATASPKARSRSPAARCDAPTKAVKPRWTEMGFGERVTIEAEAEIGDEHAFGNGAGWLVASGRPLEEMHVAIVDEDGNELPEGHLGEVKVIGPNVADGYTVDTGSSTSFQDGALHTGDAALMLDGELFVLGRIGDSMKIRGRTVFVEDVEAQVNATEGIASRKVVVLAGADGSRNTLAAIVEAKRGAWVEEVARILEAEAGGDAQVKVLASPPRTIQRTSSGKPRRRLMWKDLLNGSMPGEVVFTNGSSDEPTRPVLAQGHRRPRRGALPRPRPRPDRPLRRRRSSRRPRPSAGSRARRSRSWAARACSASAGPAATTATPASPR